MYAAISRADPSRTETKQNKIKIFFQRPQKEIESENRHSPASALHKNRFMQNFMQKLNPRRADMQPLVDMPCKALKRPKTAFCAPGI